MAYKNNHYVPQLILRRFGERLCTYNIKSGEFKTQQDTASVFSEYEFYPVEVEKEFNALAEAPFALILNQKLLKAHCGEEIELTRKEVYTIRKFLLLEQLRVFVPDAVLANAFFAQNPDLGDIAYPFKEITVENETYYDRWIRNIRVILESSDLHHIQDHPQCTYEAYRWAQVYNSGYMAIWDSSYDQTEFVISDIGMTSEIEDSYYDYGTEVEKKQYLISQIERYSDSNNALVQMYHSLLASQMCFHENFYMFSISKNRMIVVINPFFILYTKREKFPEPSIWPSRIKDRRLFEKNRSPKLATLLGKPLYSDSDVFKYKVQSMKHDDILWVNMLMLDRIDTLLGFTSLREVSESVGTYIDWHKDKGIKPRNDYSKLYDMIKSQTL